MHEAGPNQELEFYREVHSHGLDPAKLESTLFFSRAFSDLARRLIYAQGAIDGIPSEIPPLLGLPAFQAYLEVEQDFHSAFRRHIPLSWSERHAEQLAELGQWLAVGYNGNGLTGDSYQLWISRESVVPTLVGGRRKTSHPSFLDFSAEIPIAEMLAASEPRPIALIAHYDVHGLGMLALSQRQLEKLGYANLDCALGFEWTGDISKLWKRAVPKTIQSDRDYAAVFLIDCSVHSRNPDYSIKAVSKLDNSPDTQLVVIDHHEDTFKLGPRILRERVHLVFTDVMSCGLVSKPDKVDSELMALGALGDKVPEAKRGLDEGTYRRLSLANAEFHRRAIHFSPTPAAMKESKSYPLKPLWSALADGRQPSERLAEETLGQLEPQPAPETPKCQVVGSAVVVTSKLKAVGRAWYGILEQLTGFHSVPYAIAMRVLDGKRANILFLTRWQSVEMPPIKLFIPARYQDRCLGHPGAVWADVGLEEALPLLKEVIGAINDFLVTPADFSQASARLNQEFLGATPPAST